MIRSAWVDFGTGRRSKCRRSASQDRAARFARRRGILCAAAISALTGAAWGDNVSWIGEGGSNLWAEGYHWTTGLPPTATDDVSIDRPTDVLVTINSEAFAKTLVTAERLTLEHGTFTISGTAQLNNLFTLQGLGELTGAGNVYINSSAVWTDQGTMSGSGHTIVSAGGTLAFVPGSYSKTLSRVLENYGTVTYAAAPFFNAAIGMANGTIINHASGTWTHSIDGAIFGMSGTNAFQNDGMFIRSGTGTTLIGGPAPVVFTNNGQVQVLDGTLWLQYGGTHTGSFTVSNGATLKFEGGHTLSAASSITNSGALILASTGDNVINGSLSSTGTISITAATHTFNGTVSATALDVSGGTVNFNNAASLATPTFTNMTLGGAGDVTITSSGTWTANGTMNGAGRTIVATGAKLTLFSQTLAKSIERTILNQGTIDWAGNGAGAVLNLTNGTFNNQGTFNVLGDSYSLNGVSGTNAFNNSGQFVKSGTGSASITGSGTSAVVFNNSGTVSVSAGLLTFDTTLNNSNRVDLSGGQIVLNKGVLNTGLLNVTGGTLSVGGTNTTVALGTFAASGAGQINITGVLDNTSATLNLTSSTGPLRMMSASRLVGGSLTTSGSGRLEIVAPMSLDGLTIAGAATLFQHLEMNIENGLTLAGTLNLESATNVTMRFLGPPTVLGTGEITTTGTATATTTIAGTTGATLTFTPGITVRPGTRDITIGTTSEIIIAHGTMLADISGRTLLLNGTSTTNTGTFEARNGGLLSLGGELTNLSNGTLSGGVWKIGSGSSIKLSSGVVNTNAATMILDGAGSNFLTASNSDALTGLAVNAPTGNLQILNGRNFTTLNGFTNLGQLTIGSGSSFNLPLALNPPAIFDNSGTATISGTLVTYKTVNEGLIALSGTHTISTDLLLGMTSTAARYDMMGGTLSIAGLATIGGGSSGAGTFNLSGGTMSVGRALVVAANSTNSSSFALSGTANLSAAELTVAGFASAFGSFTQSGGSVTLAAGTTGLSGQLFLAVSTIPTTAGLYTMSGGTHSNEGATIGWGTTGTFAHSGGTHTISGASGLMLGFLSAGKGIYGMSNTAVLSVAGPEYIGYLGQGTFNQTGGSHAAASAVILGDQPDSIGTYNLSGGELTAASQMVGNGGVGIYNQSGGSSAITGAVTVGAQFGSLGTVNLSGGTLTAGAVNLLRGTFNQTGGTLNATAFNHSGGQVTGTLQNQGTYTYNSGAFAGRLLNQGTVVLNVNFTAANGVDNRAGFTVPAGRTVTLNGAGLANSGSVSVSGTMTTAVTVNNGTLVQNGGTGSYGNISGTGSVSVLTGSVTAALIRQDSLSITQDGRVTLSNGGGVSILKSLDIASGGTTTATLNLNNNTLLVDYTGGSPIQQIKALAASGYNAAGTHWTGPGIISSTAAADPTLGIGVVEASSALRISGTQTASFQGQTVDASTALLFITKLGDTNLDGKVSFGDFQRLELGFGSANPTWFNGDFNYDNVVDHNDFALLYQNFGQALGSAPIPSAPADWAALNVFASQVPEPGTLSWACLAGAALLMKRTRRSASRG